MQSDMFSIQNYMKDRMMSCQLLRINIHWCKRPTSVALIMYFLIVAILKFLIILSSEINAQIC